MEVDVSEIDVLLAAKSVPSIDVLLIGQRGFGGVSPTGDQIYEIVAFLLINEPLPNRILSQKGRTQ